MEEVRLQSTPFARVASASQTLAQASAARIRGNHVSNTTCITHAFFKSGE